MTPSSPVPSEAAYQQLEAHRVRAIRSVVVALGVAPVNIAVGIKYFDRAPAFALTSLVLLTTLQLVAGIWAIRAGRAALKARTADMPPPSGVRRSIVLGGVAAGAAIWLGLFVLFAIVVTLTFPAPHY